MRIPRCTADRELSDGSQIGVTIALVTLLGLNRRRRIPRELHEGALTREPRTKRSAGCDHCPVSQETHTHRLEHEQREHRGDNIERDR